MALTTITKKVLALSEIPEELREDHWLGDVNDVNYLEAHIDDEDEDDAITDWILEKYPELKDEESFFIHIDC